MKFREHIGRYFRSTPTSAIRILRSSVARNSNFNKTKALSHRNVDLYARNEHNLRLDIHVYQKRIDSVYTINELKLIGALLRPVLLSMNPRSSTCARRSLLCPSRRPARSSRSVALSVPFSPPPLFWYSRFLAGGWLLIPRRSWGPGLLKLLYGSEPKSEGLRFEIPARRARAHTHMHIYARARASFSTLPVLC